VAEERRRGAAAAWAVAGLLVLACARAALGLPPLDRVLTALERFREATGDVHAQGHLTFGSYQRAEVRLDRPWGEPPQLHVGGDTLSLDWTAPDLDTALRLLGAALSAPDLGDALHAMGRSLEPQVQTLALQGDTVVEIVGGPLGDAAAHLTLERDTGCLRAVDVPMPDGVYRVTLDDYTLADGWFPSRLEVLRDGSSVLLLELTSVHR
jgi:hypothetical protein